MPNENLKQFIDHLKTYKELTTKSDLAAFIKVATEFMKQMNSRNLEDMKQIRAFLSSLADKMKADHEEEASKSSKEMMMMCDKACKKMDKEMEKMMSEHEAKMEEMDLKMKSLKDGKDADEEKIFSTLQARLPTPEQIANEVVSNGEKVRDSLELLKGNERLDKTAIKGLDELEKEIKEIKSRPRGGGVSALGVRQAFKYIFHTEAPVGAINGVNTTYTVSNDIWAIMSFTLNGESVAELPNYTFSRKTITFSSALPAVYSGKDFEVKYIG